MAAGAEDLSWLIGQIYDCAIEPVGWRATLQNIAEFVVGEFCLLISEDAVSSQAHVHFTSRDEPECLSEPREITYDRSSCAIRHEASGLLPVPIPSPTHPRGAPNSDAPYG